MADAINAAAGLASGCAIIAIIVAVGRIPVPPAPPIITKEDEHHV